MYSLGLDIGSSSIKASLFDADQGVELAAATSPAQEMSIESSSPGFAEQDPQLWWRHVVAACQQLQASNAAAYRQISAIGISYQMHGLVVVDTQQQLLHPAIIWCDSRAVDIGREAEGALGADYCYQHLLNSPGNFTASRLRWLQLHKPEIYARIAHILLPGDYIALRLSGRCTTTRSGLSEATLWDFQAGSPAYDLLSHWGMEPTLIPEVMPNFQVQCEVNPMAAEELGVRVGTSVCYRGGDQPTNALALNAFDRGDVAATAGTSAVIYGCSDKPVSDPRERVNTFLHVNPDRETYGVLMCINGGARAYAWLRDLLRQAGSILSYEALNSLAAQAPAGCDGLALHPFGNGSERILNNRAPDALLKGLDFNRHSLAHISRATLEGVAFAMYHGFLMMSDLGVVAKTLRVPSGNLFLSQLFSETLASLTQLPIERYATNGAEGAARAAALGFGFYKSRTEAFSSLQHCSTTEPDSVISRVLEDGYRDWAITLNKHLEP